MVRSALTSRPLQCSRGNVAGRNCRLFHDYFVTHLPSSSLHPDARSSAGQHHQLPRSASKPHTPKSSKEASPAPLIGTARETTVVRIPLKSAKHHFGVSVSRGTRPYNEDTYQAGVIELPAFAKKTPVSLTRAPASSPLQSYREGQAREREQQQQKERNGDGDGEGTSAEGASGDPQVFYFGVFDGHGGTECSGFLREELHEYVEAAAIKFELQSSLKDPNQKSQTTNSQQKPPPIGGKGADEDIGSNAKAGEETLKSVPMASKKAARNSPSSKPSAGKISPTLPLPSSPPLPQDSNTDRVATLETSLMKTWRDLVGGYFRRFKPVAFSTPPEPVSMSTILTYAFLRADLDFISAQVHKKDLDTDPVASDLPLNASDILDQPSHQIGGPKRFKGGSTCSLAMISTPSPTPFWHPASPSTLITAHVGDTRILLSRTTDGSAIPITTNHHPSTPSEADRLRKYATSFVTDSFGEERMTGLANTRAFGDMASKRLGVSAEPEIRRIELQPAGYAFVCLVSDGISGTLSDQEIVDVVKEARTPEQGAKDVVAYATEVSTEGDNATCLVVRLGGWERRAEGGAGSLGTRELRDWRKKEGADPRRGRT
ncbi:hypothetical protein MMC09_001930 [Bachmanniomyces sp. S44760]|nr:hypothetical protein [Bachmanniomyces sp. S44760]